MTFRPCVVIPVYNHGATAAVIAEKLHGLQLPVIVVDDGSDAETRRILAEQSEKLDGVQLRHHPSNQGKGAAVMTGLHAAHAQGFTHVLQIDGDGQHDLADAARFLSLAEANPHAVIVGRPIFDRSVPWGRRLARYLTHIWIWIETLSFTIRDAMCGFRVYPLASTIPVIDRPAIGRRMDFDPEVLVRLHWNGVPFVTIPTRVTYPENNTSNFRLWADNRLITWMHTRLFFEMLWRLLTFRLRRPSPSPLKANGQG